MVRTLRCPSGELFVGDPFVELDGENSDKRLDELGVVAEEEEDGEEKRSNRDEDE